MNIGAFACIFLMKRGGKYIEEIEELSGVSKNHPLMSLGLMIILFSLAGIPPLAGFFAKFYIFMSVIESEMYILAIVGLVTTVVSAFYYIRIIKVMYFDGDRKDSLVSPPKVLTGMLLVTAVPTMLLGIYWVPLAEWIQKSLVFFIQTI